MWGGILVITAYAMGTLYEQQKIHMRELRDTYDGVLLILQQFITKDKYTRTTPIASLCMPLSSATATD